MIRVLVIRFKGWFWMELSFYKAYLYSFSNNQLLKGCAPKRKRAVRKTTRTPEKGVKTISGL